ncbi:GGDEF domain-containing protein [Roseibium sp.]|uniref:GGDEF domain-containing protein n=1 Tax=Roseibium sp. TaxID=1936156 RepID=UPI0039194BD7
MTWTCEQVLQDMKHQGLECDPQVFHVLFIGLTEPESDIARELRRLQAAGAPLTARAVAFLYDTYIQCSTDADRHRTVVQSSQARTQAITTSARTSNDLITHLVTCAKAQPGENSLRQTTLKLRSDLEQHLDNIITQAEALDAELRAYQAELFTDALTGVPNRRFLETELPARLNAADLSLHIALIDIDHFKKINDEHGHILGDHTIRVVASLIQTHLRPQDVLCRYGGEEFCVLFYNTEPAECLSLLETIRSDIARRTIYHNRTGKSFGPVTISAALARSLPGDDLETALHRADAQMYAAKSTGRNRVSA